MKSPREKAIRFLKYVSRADLEQVETAEQVVNVPDDAVQSAQQQTAEQVVDVPDETEPETQLDREPLDETQPLVQPKTPPEDNISRAVRLELGRILFEEKPKRRYQRARALSPNYNREPRE